MNLYARLSTLTFMLHTRQQMHERLSLPNAMEELGSSLNYVVPGKSCLADQIALDHIYFAGPKNVSLAICGPDVIQPVVSFLTKTTDFWRQHIPGEECDVTPQFDRFCEATVRCQFTQTEFRTAAREMCAEDFNESQIIFAYTCLPRKSCDCTLNYLLRHFFQMTTHSP